MLYYIHNMVPLPLVCCKSSSYSMLYATLITLIILFVFFSVSTTVVTAPALSPSATPNDNGTLTIVEAEKYTGL